ncbi:hypothetical protein [Paracoccus sp. IB05]|uniref:hypothetical protein n=1 Tax=Paracoccus sp. IB05 TaxID=2779367 RepID=UPI0018E80150|nr:hypothetical protein [Paracoccus sp. IB05]MBJ2150609.1 hypothetical protein [Paracoccus sp. IB05]
MANPTTKTTKPTTTKANADEGEKAGAADLNATGPMQSANVPATGTGGTVTGEGAALAGLSPGALFAEGALNPPVDGATDAGGPADHAIWPERIYVRGPEKGRWRAGRHFTRETVPVEVADLTEEQLSAIEDDPELTIIRVE